MSKVAVVYWSGTGNTAAMADAVAKGATNAGAEVTCADTSTFDNLFVLIAVTLPVAVSVLATVHPLSIF